ncbi:TIGR04290 family methyltransferase [Sinorhizobium meliloti]|uniref:TIGR04290 family methyltransferase n=1 Tax=Rhizobium meliloti TaxID=382 RepID=UPI000FDA941E|nr:TIGR04290 family methyltransferase [Sinorhizobium meliloti]RVJ08126.1 TIGR04290 family methyltransferase [Sinorhizobium meliloti]
MVQQTKDRTVIAQKIAALGPWFHNMRIGGIETAPGHFLGDYPAVKWKAFRHVVPEDLEGRSVLDIGCNAGFYAQEMKRRNAGRVLGIDSDPHYLRQAKFAAEQAGVDIEYRLMSVYDAARLRERFDLVIFMGVLYHLRHPLLALDLLYEHVVGDQMLFQCMQRGSDSVASLKGDYDFREWEIFDRPDYPKLFFVEHRFADDPTNWFIPNRAGVEAMLRSAGFVIEANPEREVYLLRRGERPYLDEPTLRILGGSADVGNKARLD